MRRREALLFLGVTAVETACGGSLPSPTPTPRTEATPTSTPTVAPTVAPRPDPTPTQLSEQERLSRQVQDYLGNALVNHGTDYIVKFADALHGDGKYYTVSTNISPLHGKVVEPTGLRSRTVPDSDRQSGSDIYPALRWGDEITWQTEVLVFSRGSTRMETWAARYDFPWRSNNSNQLEPNRVWIFNAISITEGNKTNSFIAPVE